MKLLFLFGTGLMAGVTHVYLGADHLAALMPLSIGRGIKAAKAGMRWGVGHSIGMIVVAAGLGVMKTAVNNMAIGLWSEQAIGVMLIAIGVLGVRSAGAFHTHRHTHGGRAHTHIHLHRRDNAAFRPSGAVPNPVYDHFHEHAALTAGVLHGLSSMSGLLAVLPSLALESLAESVLYLAAFAVGSIAAMGCFSMVFGMITHRLPYYGLQRVAIASAALCMATGAVWIVAPF